MTWSEYMAREGWRWYAYDEIAVLCLRSEERSKLLDLVKNSKTAEEMWEIVNAAKSRVTDFH